MVISLGAVMGMDWYRWTDRTGLVGMLTVCGGPERLFGADPGYRDQRKADIAHLSQQAMKRGLIGHRPVDDGAAVALCGQAEPVKPAGPTGLEMPMSRISYRPASGCLAVGVSFMVLPSMLPTRRNVPPGPRALLGSDRKVEGSVVSGHHHMW